MRKLLLRAALGLALGVSTPAFAYPPHGLAGGGGPAGGVTLGVAHTLSGTSLQITSAPTCPVGSIMIVGIMTNTNDPTSISDGNTETFNNTTVQTIDGGDRSAIYWAKLANAFTGGTITVNIAVAHEMTINAACFSDGGTVDKSNQTKALANTTPNLDVPVSGTLTSQPQYVALMMWAEAGMGTPPTFSGMTKINEQVISATYGIQLWYQRVTSTALVNYAASGAINHWSTQAVTFTSP